jgi:hypothetical protein
MNNKIKTILLLKVEYNEKNKGFFVHVDEPDFKIIDKIK